MRRSVCRPAEETFWSEWRGNSGLHPADCPDICCCCCCTETRSAEHDGKRSFHDKTRLLIQLVPFPTTLILTLNRPPPLTTPSSTESRTACGSSSHLKDVPPTARDSPTDTSSSTNIVSVNIRQVALICYAADYSLAQHGSARLSWRTESSLTGS